MNNKSGNLFNSINIAINSSNCDCIGCVISGSNCKIPFLFHSDSRGILNWFGLNVNYTLNNIPPVVSITSVNTINQKTNDTIYSYCNATDANNDTLSYNFKWFLNGALNRTDSRGNINSTYTSTYEEPLALKLNLTGDYNGSTGDIYFMQGNTVDTTPNWYSRLYVSSAKGTATSVTGNDCLTTSYSTNYKTLSNGSWYCVNDSSSNIWKLQPIWNDTLTITLSYWKIPFGASSQNISLDTLLPKDVYEGNWSISCRAYDGTDYSSWLNSSIIWKDYNAPNLTIIKPEAKYYSSNYSLTLNLSVLDRITQTSCIYSVKNSSGAYEVSNITFANCNNQTFNVSGNGLYILRVYANDSVNNINFSSVDFGVSMNAPAVVLDYPSNDSYFASGANRYFNFTPTDSDGIKQCDLYANFNGLWGINETFTPVTNATMRGTTKNIAEGSYLWNVNCTDNNNNSAFALNNFTTTIDLTKPTLNYTYTITDGTQTFIFQFTPSDINLNYCRYSIYKSSGLIDGLNNNISFSCNNAILNSGTATVTAFGDYSIRVYAVDKAGNEDNLLQSISITASSVTTAGGGGGSSYKEINTSGSILPTQIAQYILFFPWSPYSVDANAYLDSKLELDRCESVTGLLSCSVNEETRIVDVNAIYSLTGENNEFTSSINDTIYIYTDNNALIKVPASFGVWNFKYYIPIASESNVGYQKESWFVFYDTNGDLLGVQVWWIVLVSLALLTIGGYIFWANLAHKRRVNRLIKDNIYIKKLTKALNKAGGKIQ